MTKNIEELLQKIMSGSDHFWNPPHVQLATVSDKNSWDTSTQPCFFYFLPISSSSQCCLSQLTYQILHTNIGRARRQQSVPTILTETVPSIFKVIFLT